MGMHQMLVVESSDSFLQAAQDVVPYSVCSDIQFEARSRTPFWPQMQHQLCFLLGLQKFQ